MRKSLLAMIGRQTVHGLQDAGGVDSNKITLCLTRNKMNWKRHGKWLLPMISHSRFWIIPNKTRPVGNRDMEEEAGIGPR